MKKAEELNYTSDIRVRAFGKNLSQLFVNAAEGMFTLVTGGKTQNKAGMGFLTYKKLKVEHQKEKIVCEAPDKEALLIFWLTDLLYAYNNREILFLDYDIQEISETHLKSSCYGPHIHDVAEPKIEIKAVTFRQSKIESVKDGLEAEVLFDI